MNKLQIESTPTIVSDGLQGTVMGITSKGANLISYFLRDKIYNDKILAPIREYITNAVDEHRKHSIDRPVLVTLTDTEWSCRDYANGLSKFDIENVFGMFGESTKENSENECGMFGLGSKSGHSYTDTFYVTSYHNGMCSTYVATLVKGDRGIPTGKMYQMGEPTPTTESGLEVRFFVNSSDRPSFAKKTEAVVRWFTVSDKIEFNDSYKLDVITPNVPTDVKTFGDITLSRYAETSNLNGYIWVRMGGVLYKMDLQLPYPKQDCMFHKEPGVIIADVPIGKLSISVTRENLETTEQNTKILEQIRAHYMEIAEKELTEVVVPKLGEYIFKREKSKLISVDWVSFALCDIKRELYDMRSAISVRSSYDASTGVRRLSLPDESGVYTIYTIPSGRSSKDWEYRLNKFLGETTYACAYYDKDTKRPVHHKYFASVDHSDVRFVDVKTMKLPSFREKVVARPKVAEEDKQYTIYRFSRPIRNGHNGYASAKELEEYAASKAGLFADKWYENTKTFDELAERTIVERSKIFSGTTPDCYVTNSAKFAALMVAQGWLLHNSPEWTAQRNRIRKTKEEQDKLDAIKYTIAYNMPLKWDRHALVDRAMINRPERIDKIRAMINTIKEEDSVRGKIMSALQQHKNLDRVTLRKILTMK